MTLLFDRDHAYLGELMTRDGALRSIVLSAKGESEIGPAVSVWQTQGISTRRTVSAKGGSGGAFFVERVLPRDSRFAEAFGEWASDRKIFLIELPEKRLWYWERLLHLPFSADERFAYILGIAGAAESRLKDLKKFFQDAQANLGGEQSVLGKRALNQLKVKLAKQMTRGLISSSS